MSIILQSGDAISRSICNHSKTKQMYSFGKAERFPREKDTGYANKFYDWPEVKMTRATSLGKGKKYDFISDAKSKSPVFYDAQSDFDPNHAHGPKYSFGVGRDKFGKTYCEGTKALDLCVPGPGKYDYRIPFGSDAVKYTIKGKRRPNSVEMGKSPGPGHYDNINQINPNGRFVNSKFGNLHSICFGKDKSKRFVYSHNDNPSPWDYPQKQWIGAIFDSRFKSNMPKSWCFKYNNIDSRLNYPGPGEYIAPSEFGIYGSKYAVPEDKKSKRAIKKKL